MASRRQVPSGSSVRLEAARQGGEDDPIDWKVELTDPEALIKRRNLAEGVGGVIAPLELGDELSESRRALRSAGEARDLLDKYRDEFTMSGSGCDDELSVEEQQEVELVAGAHLNFYEAVNTMSVLSMKRVWLEGEKDASCTHPLLAAAESESVSSAFLMGLTPQSAGTRVKGFTRVITTWAKVFAMHNAWKKVVKPPHIAVTDSRVFLLGPDTALVLSVEDVTTSVISRGVQKNKDKVQGKVKHLQGTSTSILRKDMAGNQNWRFVYHQASMITPKGEEEGDVSRQASSPDQHGKYHGVPNNSGRLDNVGNKPRKTDGATTISGLDDLPPEIRDAIAAKLGELKSKDGGDEPAAVIVIGSGDDDDDDDFKKQLKSIAAAKISELSAKGDLDGHNPEAIRRIVKEAVWGAIREKTGSSGSALSGSQRSDVASLVESLQGAAMSLERASRSLEAEAKATKKRRRWDEGSDERGPVATLNDMQENDGARGPQTAQKQKQQQKPWKAHLASAAALRLRTVEAVRLLGARGVLRPDQKAALIADVVARAQASLGPPPQRQTRLMQPAPMRALVPAPRGQDPWTGAAAEGGGGCGPALVEAAFELLLGGDDSTAVPRVAADAKFVAQHLPGHLVAPAAVHPGAAARGEDLDFFYGEVLDEFAEQCVVIADALLAERADEARQRTHGPQQLS